MKQLIRLTLLCTCAGLALTAYAGPGGKEMKQVAPPPPECNWTGFYLGLHVGGQWGHSEDRDLDGYQGPPAASGGTMNLELSPADKSATTSSGTGSSWVLKVIWVT